MLKSIRQKRIDDDNNKKWGLVRYSVLERSDRYLPNFDNTNYWNEISENSSWTTNGKRGVALPDPYYNGYKVSDEYTTPIDSLLAYIGLLKAATLEANALGIIGASTVIGTIQTAIWKTVRDTIVTKTLQEAIAAYKRGELTLNAVKALIVWLSQNLPAMTGASAVISTIIFSSVMWFIINGFLAGNTYKDIYDAWNSFEQDSINAQHKVDTEVDDDGNPLWSGYKVVYNIDYGNKIFTMSSIEKLIKNHKLIRGRHRSLGFSSYNLLYTFSYTKTITYIPA